MGSSYSKYTKSCWYRKDYFRFLFKILQRQTVWGQHYTFIAQFGGRHEDLSHPENSYRPRAKPEGDVNFLGGTNLRVSRLTGQLIVYYTESCSTTLYSASTERCAVRHDMETRRLEGNTTICSLSTWLLLTNHISLFVISIIWGILINKMALEHWNLYHSCQVMCMSHLS